RVDIRIFVIKKLTDLHQGDFSKAIGRIIAERSVDAAADKKCHPHHAAVPSQWGESVQEPQLGDRVDVNRAEPIVEVGFKERADRGQLADGSNKEIPRLAKLLNSVNRDTDALRPRDVALNEIDSGLIPQGRRAALIPIGADDPPTARPIHE